MANCTVWSSSLPRCGRQSSGRILTCAGSAARPGLSLAGCRPSRCVSRLVNRRRLISCQTAEVEEAAPTVVAPPPEAASEAERPPPEVTEAGPAQQDAPQPLSGPPSNGQTTRRAFTRSENEPREVINHTLQVGDKVSGKVVWSAERGAKIALALDTRIRGFCPGSHTPLQLRDHMERVMDPRLTLGLTREFEVLQVPEQVEARGRGPLLSAKTMDMPVFWRRAHQIAELCKEDMETVRVKIRSVNRGGLIGVLNSIVIFIPFSKIPKDPGVKLTAQDLEEQYMGREVDVYIESVEQLNNKVVGDICAASQAKLMRNMQVGTVVWCKVASLQHFGAFMTMDGTQINALVHVSNISRVHVDGPQEVFSVGERVRALIIGMEGSMHRISLSTAELEEEDGDMLNNKEKVYATAEEQAVPFREYLQGLKDRGEWDTNRPLPNRRTRERGSRRAEMSDRYDRGDRYGNFADDDNDPNDIWN